MKISFQDVPEGYKRFLTTLEAIIVLWLLKAKITLAEYTVYFDRSRPLAPGGAHHQGIAVIRLETVGGSEKVRCAIQTNGNESRAYLLIPKPKLLVGKELLRLLQPEAVAGDPEQRLITGEEFLRILRWAAAEINFRLFPHRRSGKTPPQGTPTLLLPESTTALLENVDEAIRILTEKADHIEHRACDCSRELEEKRVEAAACLDDLNNQQIRRRDLAADIADLRERKHHGHFCCCDESELAVSIGKLDECEKYLNEAASKFDGLQAEVAALETRCEQAYDTHFAAALAAEELSNARYIWSDKERRANYLEILDKAAEKLAPDQLALIRKTLLL